MHDLISRALEYVERFADLQGEPEGGDCRALIAEMRKASALQGEPEGGDCRALIAEMRKASAPGYSVSREEWTETGGEHGSSYVIFRPDGTPLEDYCGDEGTAWEAARADAEERRQVAALSCDVLPAMSSVNRAMMPARDGDDR